jgi:glycosyltransferase involved in cell wall biosynthesis
MQMAAPRPYDVVMFTMDARIDRRIILEAETLIAAGLSVRILAPATVVASGPDRSFVERLESDPAPLRSIGLSLYRHLRDGLNIPPAVLRALYWRVYRQPERFFLGLFSRPIATTAARLYVAHDLPMLPVALAAAHRHGGNVLFDSHELYAEQEFSRHERRMWNEVEARHIGRASTIVTVNRSIAEELAKRHGVGMPLVVQNCERWRPPPEATRQRPLRQALGLSQDVPLVLYQGGLSATRNIATLVEAFAHIRHPAAVLAILGDGPDKQRLETRVRRQGLGARVRFHAAVPQDELPMMTASADLGVIPYQADCLNTRLCTPNKLYEFIMARLPIIATDLPELRRIVAGYGIGVVGDTGSPQAFAALIDDALEPAARQNAASRLERAARELSWDREEAVYLQAIKSLMPAARTFGKASSGKVSE